jgi:putative SOS response-associated peptidase YedK
MCGRYLTPDQAAFERYWGIEAPPDFAQSYNVAPSQLAPVVRRDPDGVVVASLMTWGFRPAWAKRGWINARSETAFQARAFADAARRHRCLVPAMGWYEWQSDKSPKQPFVLHHDGFVPLAFAGIWTARKVEGVWHRSFAILTQAALDSIRSIHDRMPAVLPRDAQAAWLHPDADVGALREALARSAGGIRAYPVSPLVNKPENDDPSLISPAS